MNRSGELKLEEETGQVRGEKKDIVLKDKPIEVAPITIDGKQIVITGGLVKTAKLEEEWFEDVEAPELLVAAIKESKINADIFTFWQRLPETNPKYSYYMEVDNIAVLPVKSFDYWSKKQIDTNARRAIKKAQKSGVIVKEVKFDDEFIKGMTNIFNETPIRQGKPFWHYGKDFETVKREFSRYLFREDLIGAYYNDELIGFIFLANAGNYVVPGQIISKIEHRDKAPNNALIAKAVEICEKKKTPYFVYFYWGDGTLSEFKRRNGFEKVALPRYYIPLNVFGHMILKLHLHRGIIGVLPRKIVLRLKEVRSKFYELRYRKNKRASD
jgi:hypothetical protein